MRGDASKGADFSVRGNESGFSKIVNRIKGVRSDASRGASFSVKSDESGFSNITNRIKGVRSDASRGASMQVRGNESGFAGITNQIKGVRSDAQRGAMMEISGDGSGLKSVGGMIENVRGDASRGADMEIKVDDSQLKSAKESLGSIGETAAGVAGGLALEDVGSGMADNFREAGRAVGGFQGRLGASKKEATDLAGVGKNVFKGAWGESLGEVNQAVTTVAQGLGTMGNAAKTQRLTEQAMTLSDAYGMDVTESVEAARQMSQNFGISAERAFDLVSAGARDGANVSGDLTDSIREYAPMFSRLGISGKQAMGMFAEGANQGIWNTDRLGDAVKEFSIRAVDGSDTTKEGFKMAGLSAKEMSGEIAKGGPAAQQAFQKTVDGIRSIEDPQKRAQAGVALFGTLYEDIGEKGLIAMQKGSDGLGKVDGSAKKTGDSLYNNMTTRLQGMTRSVQMAASDAGLGGLGSAMGGVAETAGFTGLAVMGIGPMFPKIAAMAMGAAPVMATAFTIMTGPVGLTIAAIAAVAAGVYLIYRNWGTIGPWFAARWEQVKNAAGIAWTWVKDKAAAAWRGVKNAFSGAGEWATGKFNALKDGAVNALSGLKDGAIAKVTGAKNAIVGGLTSAKDRGVAVLGSLASGGVGRLSGLKDRGLAIAGGLKFGTLSRFQEMKTGSHGRIGQLVAGGISRFVNLQKRGLASIGSFVGGGLSKYQQMRKGGSSRFEALKGAITNRLGVAKTQGLARISELGSGAMSRWTNQWNNAKTRYSGIRDTIGNNLRKGKEWGTARVKELGGNLLRSTGNQLGNAKDKYSSIRDTIGTNLRKGKDWGTNRIKELGGNLIRSTGNQLGNAKDKYSAIAGTVNTNLDKARKWGSNRVKELGGNLKDSFGNMLEGAKTFGRKWAGHVVDGIKAGVNKARAWMGGLMTAVGNVLGAIGADKLAGAAKERGAKLKAPLEMASGGIVGMRDGGMASSPTVLYGEAGPEAYVRLDKRTPESQKAARAVMASPNAPEDYGRGGGPAPVRKHRRTSTGEPWIPPANPQHGGGPGYPPINYTPTRNWNSEAYGFVKKVESKFPDAFVNTYQGHGQFPGGEAQSWDVWGPGQSSIETYPSAASNAFSYISNLIGNRMKYMIYRGSLYNGAGTSPYTGYGGQHYDHVHTSIVGSGESGTSRGGGNSGGGGFDWMGAITSGLSNIEKPSIGAGMLGEAFGGFGMDLLGKAKDWLIEKAKGIWGSTKRGIGNLYNNITEGGANRELGKKMLAASGVPGSWDALENLWTKESNWDERADNPSSDAYGIPQALPGSKMASHGSDWLTNPKTQIAWGLDYIRDRYGSTDAAWGHSQNMNWYARGGIHDEVGRGQVTSGITAIAGEAGTEAIVPMERKTPEGQHALRTALTGPNAPREYRRAKKFASGGMNWGLVGSDRYIGFGGSTRYSGYLSNALDAWNGLGVVGVGGGSDINVYDAYLGGSTLGKAYSNGNIALNTALLDQYPPERIQSTVSHEVGHILDLPHQSSGLMSTPSYPGRASFPGGREQSLLEGIYGSAAPERGNETYDPPKSGSPGGLSGSSGSTSSSYSSNKISMSGGGKQSYSVSSSNSRGSGGSSGASTGIGFARNIISNVLGGDANLKRLANNVELWGAKSGDTVSRDNIAKTDDNSNAELRRLRESNERIERKLEKMGEEMADRFGDRLRGKSGEKLLSRHKDRTVKKLEAAGVRF